MLCSITLVSIEIEEEKSSDRGISCNGHSLLFSANSFPGYCIVTTD